MAMHKAAILALWALLPLAGTGCGPTSSSGPAGLEDPSSGPFGPESDSPLLAPFAGHWLFEFEKTLAAQKADGVSDEQIAQLRKLFSDNLQLGKMHPDLTIKGNVAVGTGMINSEYRFFSMHEHDSKVCGKAWHHED